VSELCLITGASGFIGGRLASRLRETGRPVRCLVRSSSDTSLLEELCVEIAVGDLTDARSLAGALDGCGQVLHCGALVSDWATVAEISAINVAGTRALLNAAAAASVSRFVHLSTTDVYGYPQVKELDETYTATRFSNWYAQTKLQAEAEVSSVQAAGALETVILRPATVYGPGSKEVIGEIARAIKGRHMLLVDGGRANAGLCYVENLIDAALLALEHDAAPGNAFNVSDGLDVSWRQLTDDLAEALGCPRVRWSIPYGPALGLGFSLEHGYRLLRRATGLSSPALLSRQAVQVLGREQAFSNRKLRQTLGWEPRIGYEAGLRATVAWLQNEYLAPSEPAHVYRFDATRRPDSEFQPGSLSLLVPGNEGRLLDARRTPMRIVGVDPDEGTFELEIRAFEDSGAHWSLPFEDVDGYQFAAGSQAASEQLLDLYTQTARRLDRPLLIDADPEARTSTLNLLDAQRRHAADWLDARGLIAVEVAERIAARDGEATCARLLQAYLAELELLEMDTAFSQIFVSNPRSGELVKGHAIVLAELGLCAFEGKVVRGTDLFDGDWSRQRRAQHLIARMAVTRALWERATPREPPLYRAMASDGTLDRRSASSFVSGTFSLDVATDHFRGGPSTSTAAILRQPLPQQRLLMTFLETPAMNAPFKEAEAVLIGPAGTALF
jgi:nucleoside-diphosphate-sugar epimerase